MYCNNCGKFLLENDKFCSNCGARVFQNEQDSVKAAPPAEASADPPENQPPKPTPPLDNIKWNIEDFPGHDVKKTEEINFDWGNTSVFKKTEPAAEEIAFNPAPKEDEPKADEQEQEEIIQGKDLEEEIFAEASLVESISSGTDSHRRTKIVDKFYTFNKKNEEFQKLLDQEYEKIKEGINDVLDDQTFRDQVSEINQKSEELWPEFNPTEHIAEMALARERFFGTMTGIAAPDEPRYTEEPKPVKEPEVVETPEPEAVEKPVPEAVVTPSPETEELPGEEPLPEENILPDLEICNEEQTMHRSEPLSEPESETEPQPEPETEIEVEAQPEFVPQVATPEERDSDAAAGLVEEPATPQTIATALDDKLVPEDFDDVNSIRDKWIKYEEDEDDEDEGRSGGKVGKFIIGLLVLLLLVQLALLGIKLVAPESAVAQFVDEKVQKVILFFQGSDNVSQALVTDRTIAAEDKTGLIQLAIQNDKNYNGNIAVIKYNGELRLNTAKKYSDTSLNQSVILQDNEWYTKDDGTAVYYDEQAIGAIISYESTRRLADGEAFATLEIGEIRINGEDLFVWVAEEIAPGDRQEKIFRITVSGETMNVNTEYDV